MGEKKLSIDQITAVGSNDEQDDLLNMFDDLNVSIPDFLKKKRNNPASGAIPLKSINARLRLR